MADVKYYDVILKPVITEKSMNDMMERKYTFYVHTEATKGQIKEAVEKTKVFSQKFLLSHMFGLLPLVSDIPRLSLGS